MSFRLQFHESANESANESAANPCNQDQCMSRCHHVHDCVRVSDS